LYVPRYVRPEPRPRLRKWDVIVPIVGAGVLEMTVMAGPLHEWAASVESGQPGWHVVNSRGEALAVRYEFAASAAATA
jgi:hypothetical protein